MMYLVRMLLIVDQKSRTSKRSRSMDTVGFEPMTSRMHILQMGCMQSVCATPVPRALLYDLYDHVQFHGLILPRTLYEGIKNCSM